MARDLGGIYTAIEADVTGLKKSVAATKKLAAIADKQFKKVSGTARKEFAIVARAAEKAARAAERDYKESARVAIASAKAQARGSIAAAKATEKAAKDGARVKAVAARKAEKAVTMAAKRASMASIKATRLAAQEAKAASRTTALAAKKAARASAVASAKVARVNKIVTFSFLAVAASMVLVLRKSILMADQYNILQQRIKAATLATGDYAEVSKELSAIAHRTGTELLGNVALFQTLARTAPELHSTNKEMLRLTETLGQLGVIGGSSTMQMRNGLLQFSQAMAGGIFRAEEMNGIIENIPEVAARMAKGLGVTVGKMRLLTLEGNLSAKAGFEALKKQTEEINLEFSKMPETIARSTVKMGNSLGKFFGRLDKAKGVTKSIAESMTSLATTLNHADANAYANGIERVAFYLAAIAAVRLGYVVKSMWALSAATRASGAALKASGWVGFALILTEVGLAIKNSKEVGDNLDKAAIKLAKFDLNKLQGIRDQVAIKGPAGAGFQALYEPGELKKEIDQVEALIRTHKQNLLDRAEEFKDIRIQARIAKGYDSGVKFDESHGNRFRSNNIVNSKKYASQQQDIADNAAADKLAKQKQTAQQWIGSFAKGLMTERELLANKHKTDLANLNTAERTKVTTLLPYAELRKRLLKQHEVDYAVMLAKKSEALRNSLTTITRSLMTEKQARAAATKDTLATLKEGLDRGILSWTEYAEKKANILAKSKQLEGDLVAQKLQDTMDATGIDAIRESLKSKEQIELEYHQNRMDSINAAHALERENTALFHADLEAEKARHEEAMAGLTKESVVNIQGINKLAAALGFDLTREVDGKTLAAHGDIFDKQLELGSKHNKAVFEANKVSKVAQALLAAPSAILSSYTFGSEIGGPFLGAIFAGLAATATAAQVAAISSASFGGGRLYGGSVAPNTAYNVNEDGRPELLTVGGKDMLMMGSQGGKVTPNNQLGGSSDVTIKVIVTNIQGQEAKVTGQRETSDGFEIDVFMEAIDKFTAAGITDGTSDTAVAMGKQYGVNRAYGNF